MKASRDLSFRLLAITIGLVLTLAGTEVVLRLTKPYKTHQAARELRNFRDGGEAVASLFQVDEEMGFRPRLDSQIYSAWGTLVNDYPLAKDPAKKRLLFIGDSVTYRGKIVRAVQERLGDGRFEYWNAGVESFNVNQAVAFYQRWNQEIEPDHVVLTFHLNDFQTTPIAFQDEDGSLVVYAPHRSSLTINKRLFQNWHLYRLYIGVRTNRRVARERVADEVEAALAALQAAVAPPAQLTVLIFPILSPYGSWTEEEQWAHETVTGVLKERSIEFFDLLPTLESALESGVAVREQADDPWHPSADFGAEIARDLESKGFMRL